uniref:Uncharacterized protein n=1 Tax=Cannabis sativa TaxID=3483 RepID=A0A803QK49_CANSA
MAKKKRIIRKTITRSDPLAVPEFEDELEGSITVSTAPGEGSFNSDAIQTGELLETRAEREVEQERNEVQKSPSWAKEVEKESFQASAKQQWQSFTSGKISYDKLKLRFTEPVVKEGKKIAMINIEEVKIQATNWSSSVICMVLGANPPFIVFERFIERV